MKYVKSILFLIFFFTNSSYAQDTTKVLFIGNSFTSANNLPNLFKLLAQDAGHHVIVESHMPGGISVGDIRQGNQAHMNNPHVYNLIKGNNWDFMVLQDNQGRFSHPYGQFANPITQSRVIEGHLQIRDSLLYYHPCANMIWFGGFGTKDGLGLGYTSGSALIDAIYGNYNFLNDTAQEVIAPIGPAFKRIISGHLLINLWGADNTHPSLHGSFLTSCVIYTTIFKQSPTLSTYNPGISAFNDSLLKTVGYQTTIDSLNSTGLNEITPIISKSNDTLAVHNYQGCSWFYNNILYNSSNCTTILNKPGYYSAIVTDSDGCQFRTLEYEHVVTNINIEHYTSDEVSIYPNPTEGEFRLNLDDSKGPFTYTITTINGEVIKHQNLNVKTTVIDLADYARGVYILQIKTDGHVITKKIIKR